jgi:hypothetical protein
MTQRVLICTMHFARKRRKWIGIPVYALECQGSLSAAPDILHSKNTDAKSAPHRAGEFECRSGLRCLLGKLPGFQNTTMNEPSESSRPWRGSKDLPRKICEEETRPVPHQKCKSVNQVRKHQQTITDHCLLCVITCVTFAISKAAESSRSFIYRG